MADGVEECLDRMVAPLRDLCDRGIFSVAEIQAVVVRRKRSEYAVRKTNNKRTLTSNLLLADWMSYLQDETQLEELRHLRTIRLRKEKVFVPNTLGDAHVEQHIHILWQRCLRKFPQLQVYQAYFDYLQDHVQAHNRARRHRQLTAGYAQCLARHPTAARIWIQAAEHAYFQQNSILQARILLQRGLRANATNNSNAEILWTQSFVLEMHWVAKLKGRAKVLLSRSGSSDDDDDESPASEVEDDDDDDDDNDNDNSEKDTEKEDAVAVAVAKESETIQKSDDSYKLSRLVWDHGSRALAEHNSCLRAFRLACVEATREFPDTQELQSVLWRDLLTTTPETFADPQVWMARVAWLVEHNDGESAEPRPKKRRRQGKDDNDDTALSTCVWDTLEQALEKVPTKDMILQSLAFAKDYPEKPTDARRRRAFFDCVWNVVDDSDCDDDGLLLRHDSDLVVARAHHWMDCGDGSRACQVLEAATVAFSDNNSNKNKNRIVPHVIWRHWARLVQNRQETDDDDNPQTNDALAILKRGRQHVPMHDPGHYILLLESLGCLHEQQQQKHEPSTDKLSIAAYRELLQAIVLLHTAEPPRFDPLFGVANLPQAGLVCLAAAGNESPGWIYQAILYSSSAPQLCAERQDDQNELDAWKLFMDHALQYEIKEQQPKHKKQRANQKLIKLTKVALEMFEKTEYEEEFRRQREEMLYGNHRACPSRGDAPKIPFLDCRSSGFDLKEFSKLFEKYRVAHIRGLSQKRHSTTITWKDIGALFAQLNKSDQASWCVETKDSVSRTAKQFLQPIVDQERAYCSFLVQKDKEAYQSMLDRLPIEKIPGAQWHYEPALWVFFGRNPADNKAMDGRPEHTDSVSHEGSWHFQLSGSKVWSIRPTTELMDHFQDNIEMPFNELIEWSGRATAEIKCQAGDVLVIDTRVWFHKTSIPSQRLPSVSYARDFYTSARAHSAEVEDGMTNVDGMYATEHIESGSIIFTENEMPDGELHRSSENPNCEVVQLEDGTNAVVSTRQINSGEFFAVPLTDDSSEEEMSVESEM